MQTYSDENDERKGLLAQDDTPTEEVSAPVSISSVPSIHVPQVPTANSNQTAAAVLSPAQAEKFAQLNSEYLKRRYRRKYENPERIRELLAEQIAIVENLQTAIEGKMDVAVIGVLQSILVALDSSNNIEGSVSRASVDAGDRQRALFKANICMTIDSALRQMGGQAGVCEKVLQTIAYLCRYSDENKASVCLENAKAFGVLGVGELIVGAVKRHKDDKKVVMAACDAIRCMCCLESNRERFGNAGACEAIARALVKTGNDPETVSWLCRAVGHLANNSENNRELLGNAGACQTVVMVFQKFAGNMFVCAEACWAIRQLAPSEENRSRFATDFAPESILAVFPTHFKVEPFAVEACQAIAKLIGSEDDEIIVRIYQAQFQTYAFRSLKKFVESSEQLARWVYQVLYYFACNDAIGPKLISGEVLDTLSICLENHASDEFMAEWGCRFVHKMIRFDGASAKMRNAGMNEMVTSAVQRQAISKVVSSVGCLAIGDLARDMQNLNRLSSSGACEAAVGALKRHNASVDVTFNSSYAIHYLCQTQNNISWMGANGACEAVTDALKKHLSTSEEVAKFCSNALGSLAFKDEGNQVRLFHAGGCEVITEALLTHSTSAEVAESTCRAMANLCQEPQNVSELGKVGACGLVVAVLQNHAGDADVITQALLAIHGLAVKAKLDKVQKGNTRKLVEKGAIEMVVSTMQRFGNNEKVQRAAAMAISSLARLEVNRQKLGAAGACELVGNALRMHIEVSQVIAKLALAIDALAVGSEANKAKFTTLNVVSNLIIALQKHEKDSKMVADILRALVNLSSVEANKKKICTAETFKLIVRLMKMHEKSDNNGIWSCTLIYTASTSPNYRIMLGEARACEATISALAKHGEKNAELAAWGCKAVVGLSLSDPNKEYFHNPESCTALVKVLQSHSDNPTVAEWCSAAIVSVAVFPQNRVKLGSSGVCVALCAIMNKQSSSETILRLACEAVFELAKDATNQNAFKNAGVNDVLVNILQGHIKNGALSAEICRAISSVATNNLDNANKLAELGASTLIMQALAAHVMNPSLCQWAACAIFGLCSRSEKIQAVFGSMDAIASLAPILHQHQNVAAVITQATRAIRTLCYNNKEIATMAGKTGIVQQCLALIKIHVNVDFVCEHCGWIIGNIEYKPPKALVAGCDFSRPISMSTVSDLSSRAGSTADETAPPAIESTASAAAVEASPAAPSMISARSFYTNLANWDILFAALRAHEKKPTPLRWLCSAVAIFAERGQLSHATICDFLVAVLERHLENDNVTQKVLTAIGSLARTNKENNLRLSYGNNLLQTIDSVLSSYLEGSTVIYGALPAIAGLAEGNEANRTAFYNLPNVCTTIVKVVYDELETPLISHFGCTAVRALAMDHPRNKAKLGVMCSYIADVLVTYQGNLVIVTEALHTIATLAHKSITNRNRLGSSDACSAVMLPMNMFFDDHINATFMKVDKSLLFWTMRAIADLAANNPNNQAKLGHHGACDLLVKVLRQRKHVAGKFNLYCCSFIFFANIVLY